jgi:hypothetical protein
LYAFISPSRTLPSQQEGQTHPQWQFRALFQKPPEFLTGDQIHDQIKGLVPFAVIPYPDDAGMPQTPADD